MTLAFSNHNRLLFNRERSDQLLELYYNNRLTDLLDYKKSYKQWSTPYKIYLKKYSKTAFFTDLKSDFVFAKKSKKGEKHTSLIVGSSKLSLLKGSSNPYKALFCRTNHNPTNKNKYQNKYKVSNKALHTNLLTKLSNKSSICKKATSFALVRKKICTQGNLLEKNVYIPAKEKETSFCKENSFALLCEKLIPVKEKKNVVATIFVTDHFSFLKKMVSSLKRFFPKTRIWSFAIGSSFLLVIMTSVLQRQEQNRWLLSFSKNQMPGLSTASQESSWESFENIALKHLSKQNFGYKGSSGKGLVKQIDCYKDIWYLFFTRPWSQRFLHNYTAVFCRNKASTFFPPNGFCSAKIGNFAPLINSGKKEGGKSTRDVISFKSLFSKKNNQDILFQTTVLQLFNFQFFSLPKSYPLKKKWISKPLYKMHARIPPKKLQPGFFCERLNKKTPFGMFKAALSKTNWYKEQINAKNDSIPSKISCSTRAKNKSFIYSRFSPSEALYLSNLKKRLFAFDTCDSSKAKSDSYKYKAPLFKKACMRSESAGDINKALLSQKESCLEKQPSPYKNKRKKRDLSFEKATLPHDRLKNLFYDSSHFSIDSRAFQENPQETDSLYDSPSSLKRTNSDFERLVDTNRFTFLQETSFFKPSRNLSPQHAKKNLSYPLDLSKVDDLQNDILRSKAKKKYRLYESYRHTLQVKNDQKDHKKPSWWERARFQTKLFSNRKSTKSKNGCYTNLRPNLLKSGEKLSTYFVHKQNEISNRLMSGYHLPETKDLQLSLFTRESEALLIQNEIQKEILKLSIKVPPALPFYEAKMQEWRLAFFSRAGFANMEKLLRKQDLVRDAKKICKKTTKSNKKMPYRQLRLNEFQEVKPLFEQINKAFRISPYHFTFKRSLFTDYNDYLNWSKDTPAAIAITPSLEEEKEIKDSWVAEQAFSKGLKNEALWSSQDSLFVPSMPGKENNEDHVLDEQKISLRGEALSGSSAKPTGFVAPKKTKEIESFPQNRSLPLQGEEALYGAGDPVTKDFLRGQVQSEALQEAGLSVPLNKTESKDSSSLMQEETPEEDEKKREITKFEWLEQVREAEHLVEKRKDLQELAYPNREALFTKHLKVKPGMVKSLLVSDRKLSFFGIANLFPKRLIAQDQKEINSQILQDGQDQRFNLFFGQAFLKNNDIDTTFSPALENKGGCKRLINEKVDMSASNKEIISSLRTKPRNRQKSDDILIENEKTEFCNPDSPTFRTRQHPVYTPNRRLRLRAPQLSLSSQGGNSQSRIDELILSQSHRWWQKRRTALSLLGAPSKRYLVMPEIKTQDWRKIIEWQVRTYFFEEEKRLEPLVLERDRVEDLQATMPSLSNKANANQTKHLFKIKKLAIYLPWTTLKKSLNKPFEWPLTRLSYRSFDKGSVSPFTSSLRESLQEELLEGVLRKKSFVKNRKADPCFVSSIRPHFKTSFFPLSTRVYKLGKPKDLLRGRDNSSLLDTLPNLRTDSTVDGLHETSVYKPFLFESRTKNSYLLVHGLLLAVCVQHLFNSLYKLFGKVIQHKIRNSSLAVFLLPILFNAGSRKNQIAEFSQLKKRLKDLVGSEETISSLTEIVWYLRNSCRGRLIPRGVVLVETLSSESTDYLKAIGGEAQVPVIVQSLRALPFTQNHPQRRLEKILSFAQKRAPCILFLDDLDSIGKSRTLLLKNNFGHLTHLKREPFSAPFKDGNVEKPVFAVRKLKASLLEKVKWKKERNDFDFANQRELRTTLPRTKQSPPFSLQFFKSSLRKTELCKKTKYPYKSALACKNAKLYPQCKPFAFGKSEYNENKGKENDVLQASETEKVIEQRRVDLMLRLLTVMDGISQFNGVLIVTTSKNPASLDPALLRPGRFEKLINLELPSKKKRIELLKIETAKIGHTHPMPWEYFGTQTQDMTGTEISSAVNHSAFRAIIQSTVHTFPTLEYGINCVNGIQSEALYELSAHTPETQLQNGKQSEALYAHKYKSFLTSAKRSFARRFVRSRHLPLPAKVDRALLNTKIRPTSPLKRIVVDNPYKAVLKEEGGLSTRFSLPLSTLQKQGETFNQDFVLQPGAYKYVVPVTFLKKKRFGRNQCNSLLKKNREIASQISFYQAGKGIVRSSVFCDTNNQNRAKNKRDLILIKNKRDCRHSIQSHFAEGIVRLYAGQASELFYLDSITCFKNKAFMDSFSRLLFLQSTFFYEEKLQASLTIEDIASNLGFHFKAPSSFFQPNTKSLIRKFAYQNFSKPFKRGFCFSYNSCRYRRKYLQLCTNNEQTEKNFFWSKKVSETLKTFKEQSGNWYRLYLPKIEENKNNREWLLPDVFANQHISLLKEKDLPTPTCKYKAPNKAKLCKKVSCKCKAYASTNRRFVRRFVRKHTSTNLRFVNCTCSYYNMVLSGFYIAFQNCSENRELLDLLADHLIRFKIIRLHEIVRIASFYF